MKNVLKKNTFLGIKNTFKIFLSILLMAFLGVGFFAGIRATSPDMKETINNYYNQNNVYDIKIVSTLGLTNEDIDALANVEGIDKDNIIGTYSYDALVDIGEKEAVFKIHSISDRMNRVDLLNGNMPVSNNECLVDCLFLENNNKKIGDNIQISDPEDIFKEDSMKIVGVINSPLYLSFLRGASELAAGKVDFYMYTMEDNFNLDVYTEIYLKTISTKGIATYTDEYKEVVTEAKNNIDKIKEERERARYNELIDNANKEVNDAENELASQKAKALEKLEKADKEIVDAQEKIDSSEIALNNNRNIANKKIADMENQLTQAQVELNTKKKEFETQKVTVEKNIENAKQSLEEQKNNLNNTNNLLNTSKTKLESVNNSLKNIVILTPEEVTALQTQKATLEGTITQYETAILQLNGAIKQIERSIAEGENELESAKAQIAKFQNEINSNKTDLKNNKVQANSKYDSGKQELALARTELQNNINKLNEEKEKYNNEIKDAENKIIDVKNKMSKIKNSKWYILTRESDSGYSGYMQGIQNIENVGKVFPILFFVIATLISLTSMTRMVEEERTEIGTLKALGYTNLQIINKYVIYAGTATVIGGILGMCIGLYLFPQMIWMMFQMLYLIPNFIMEFNLYYGLLGIVVALLCIVGAAIYVCIQDLKQSPATLMRPKAPKTGKRVILEKISFIWKPLSFIQKVTVRNIFRYKKRALMTIVGIMGCTALILAAFGLKDSISRVLVYQYEKIFNYSQMVNLKSELSPESITEFANELKEKDEINEAVNVNYQAGSLLKAEHKEDIQVIVPELSEEIKKVINLSDATTNMPLTLNDESAFLTEKIAKELDIKVGDTVVFEDSNSKQIKFIVGGIVNNCVYNYIYMSKSLFESLGEIYETNVLLLNTIKLDENEEEVLAKNIANDSRTISVTLTSTMIKTMENSLQSLNYIVWLLIVSSGLLVFVVLYSLANVNISERKRELATIKVLGFYDKEVYSYINKETVILTVVGIILGIIAGWFLNLFMIETCEPNILRFSREIAPLSCLYAILITILFTLIVNFATYFALKKIDMIESLKSVE